MQPPRLSLPNPLDGQLIEFFRATDLPWIPQTEDSKQRIIWHLLAEAHY